MADLFSDDLVRAGWGGLLGHISGYYTHHTDGSSFGRSLLLSSDVWSSVLLGLVITLLSVQTSYIYIMY